jgi:hypothetical protein
MSDQQPQQGEVLATLERYRGAKLVITLESFEGHAYVGARVVDPTKGSKFISIKARELAAVIGALQAAQGKIGGGQ